MIHFRILPVLLVLLNVGCAHRAEVVKPLVVENFYEAQLTDSACSLASATVAVNALRNAAGKAGRVSQKEVLAQAPADWQKAVLTGGDGLTLEQLRDQLKSALKRHGLEEVEVTAVHATGAKPAQLAAWRLELLNDERDAKTMLIVNFDQGAVFQKQAAGHFSPVAKYDAATDRVFVLDPDRQFYEPYWVPAATLLSAMSTVDSDSKTTRGYLIVRVK